MTELKRRRKHGDPIPDCSINDCTMPSYCRTFCRLHYDRLSRTGDPLFINPNMDRSPMPLRWMRKVTVTPFGCFEWNGYLDKDGYGVLVNKHYSNRAHRMVWQIMVGPIEPDMTIDHLCLNRACVNPDHMEVVTNRENVLRGWRRLRSRVDRDLLLDDIFEVGA